MSGYRVAVLGGDGREVHVAERLAHDGHIAVRFGQASTEGNGVQVAGSAMAAVRGAEWVICPSPGLTGDVIFAPDAPEPIVLDAALLEQSSARSGGVILGRSTPALDEITARLGIRVFELKDDLGLATRLSTGVAEAVMRLLIEHTRRILREHRILLVGYGVTGAVILDYLVGARCAPLVAARGPRALERARQCGGVPVLFVDRVEAMGAVDIVINTVPSPDAVPAAAFERLAGRMIVDIASPPGGVDHDAARAAGVVVHWPRGLAGGRAPLTAGDAQYAFVSKVMGSHAERAPAPSTSVEAQGDPS
jgi:dipicolinate synthase subunit A